MKLIQTHSEYSWSLLDPRPVLRYVEHIDEYIVYWNGCVMPHLMALNIAMSQFGAFPTPSMKARILSNYKRIYYTNGFGEMPEGWDDCVRTGRVYRFMSSKMWEHVVKAVDGKDHAEVLGWFHYDKARREVSHDTVSGDNSHETDITAEHDVH